MNKKIVFGTNIKKINYFFVNKLVILTILDEYSIIKNIYKKEGIVMSKYCPRCGAATEQNAAFCQNCGVKIPQEQPPVQNVNSYQQNHGTVPPQQQGNFYSQQPPNQAQFVMVQQIASKIKGAAIFWLVWGILCSISGICTVCLGAAANSSINGRIWRAYYDSDPGTGAIVYGSFLLIAAIVNIIYAIIHFGYAKEIFANPATVIRKIDSSALYIVSIVVNVIFGGILGIIGGVMMLNTRTLARGNQFVFQGGHTPQRPVPPYTPQQQQPVAPPQPSVQQQTPVQQNQNEQTEETKQAASVTAEPHESESTEQDHKSE